MYSTSAWTDDKGRNARGERTGAYVEFEAQWKELVERAAALQATMHRFAIQLVATPPGGLHSAATENSRRATAEAVVTREEAARARAIGRALLTVTM